MTTTAQQSPSQPLPFDFNNGSIALEPQNDIPSFLHGYHRRSMELTSQVLLQSDQQVECVRDISYGPQPWNRLDVYKRAKTTQQIQNDDSVNNNNNDDDEKNQPVVIFLHGGGWDWGYKEWAGFLAPNVCSTNVGGGALLVTPSYAIGKGQDTVWPAARDDILAVLEWVQEHIAEYGGNPHHIVLAGHSAGGHLAACVGFLRADSNNQNHTALKAIRALFLISAPLGLRARDFLPQLWKFPPLRPVASLLYRISIVKFLRPLVGDGKASSVKRTQIAAQASPLAMLEDLATADKSGNGDVASQLHTVHYMYTAKGDFPICKAHLARLRTLLGENRVQGLVLPVETHFDTHYSLADPNCEWYIALREALSRSD